jgi:hypothetical protein
MDRTSVQADIPLSTSEVEDEARGVVWATLCDELRKKLESLEANGELHGTGFEEPLRHEFGMSANGGCISVWLTTETGDGSWNAVGPYLDMAEPCYLSASGDFKLDGKTMNLSAAADRFIAKISGQWTGPVPA